MSAQAIGYKLDNANNQSAVASCGSVTTVNFQLHPQLFGRVGGTVFEGTPDPNDLSRTRNVTSTGVPLSGVQVDDALNPTGTDGRYVTQPLFISNDISAIYPVGVGNPPAAFWPAQPVNITIVPNQTTQHDFALVRRCFGSISAMLVDQTTGLPIAGASVQVGAIDGGPNPPFANTGSNGTVTFTSVPLGYNNSQTTYTASFGGDNVHRFVNGQVGLTHCGDSVSLTLGRRSSRPPPRR